MSLPQIPADKSTLSRRALEERSRQLVAIAISHTDAAMVCVSRPQLLKHATRLGLVRRGVVVGPEHHEGPAIELAMWTTTGNTTAMERYSRQVLPCLDAEQAAVLTGLLGSVLSFWKPERRHPVAGWEMRDLSWGQRVWVVDERIEAFMASGRGKPAPFVTRLFGSEGQDFTMSCSTILPVPSNLPDMLNSGIGLDGKEPAPEVMARGSRDPAHVTGIYYALLQSAGMSR